MASTEKKCIHRIERPSIDEIVSPYLNTHVNTLNRTVQEAKLTGMKIQVKLICEAEKCQIDMPFESSIFGTFDEKVSQAIISAQYYRRKKCPIRNGN